MSRGIADYGAIIALIQGLRRSKFDGAYAAAEFVSGDFGKLVAYEIDKWAKVISTGNIKLI